MSILRRIVQNPTVAKAVPVVKGFIPYPLGRSPSSLPKLYPNPKSRYIDHRPICLRHRVTTMIEMSNLDAASELSRLAVLDKFRVERDTVFICNSVMGAMCEAKRYDEAISLFNYFFNECQALPNMLSCNLIIKACCDRDCIDDALELYRHIVLLGGRLAPGVETYRILTKALVDAKRFDEACDLVSCCCDYTVHDILIRGFLDAGKFLKASQIFEELQVLWRECHNAIAIFNVSFMEYWFKQGKDEEAMEIYSTLNKDQLGNRALKVLMEHGKKTEAWNLFREITEICDAEAVDIMMKGCRESKVPFERVRKTCYRTMIVNYCEQGNMSDAENIFAEMLSHDDLMLGPDVATYRAMINGYVKVGRVDDAIKMLNKMKISNLRKLAIHQAK